jgi:hypothetical protein
VVGTVPPSCLHANSREEEKVSKKKEEKGQGASKTPKTPKASKQAVLKYLVILNMSRSSKEEIVNVFHALLTDETDTELKDFIQYQLYLLQFQGMTIPELRKALDTCA